MNQLPFRMYQFKIDNMKSAFLLFLICLTFPAVSQTIPKDPKLKTVLMSEKWRSDINVFSSENTKRYLIYKNKEG